MNTQCPHCERPTFWPPRVGNCRVRPKNLPAGVVSAVTVDGTCMTCYRVIKGTKRPTASGVNLKTSATYHHAMTDAEIERTRQSLMQFWAARRRRGIDPEGQDPATLHRPGLTLMEV